MFTIAHNIRGEASATKHDGETRIVFSRDNKELWIELEEWNAKQAQPLSLDDKEPVAAVRDADSDDFTPEERRKLRDLLKGRID